MRLYLGGIDREDVQVTIELGLVTSVLRTGEFRNVLIRFRLVEDNILAILWTRISDLFFISEVVTDNSFCTTLSQATIQHGLDYYAGLWSILQNSLVLFRRIIYCSQPLLASPAVQNQIQILIHLFLIFFHRDNVRLISRVLPKVSLFAQIK